MTKSGTAITLLSIYAAAVTILLVLRHGAAVASSGGTAPAGARPAPVAAINLSPPVRTSAHPTSEIGREHPDVRAIIDEIAARFAPPRDPVSGRALSAEYTRAYAEKRYAPLMAKLSSRLAPDQVHALVDILANEVADKSDAQRLSLKYKVTPDRALAAADQTTTDAITTRFGREIAEEAHAFEQTLAERNTLNDLNAALVYTGSPMTAEQIDTVAGALERAKVSVSTRSPGQLSVADIDQYMAARSAALADALTTAGSVLNATQLEALKNQFEHEALYYQMRRAAAVERENASGTAK